MKTISNVASVALHSRFRGNLLPEATQSDSFQEVSDPELAQGVPLTRRKDGPGWSLSSGWILHPPAWEKSRYSLKSL